MKTYEASYNVKNYKKQHACYAFGYSFGQQFAQQGQSPHTINNFTGYEIRLKQHFSGNITRLLI